MTLDSRLARAERLLLLVIKSGDRERRALRQRAREQDEKINMVIDAQLKNEDARVRDREELVARMRAYEKVRAREREEWLARMRAQEDAQNKSEEARARDREEWLARMRAQNNVSAKEREEWLTRMRVQDAKIAFLFDAQTKNEE